MKIFSKAIATGREWKPCIECGKIFSCGEIISSISTQNGAMVTYWYCYKCIERFFRPRPCTEYDPEYICHRVDRLIELKKFNKYKRYAAYSNIESCSRN